MTDKESASESTGHPQAAAELETVEMSTGVNPDAAIIWLHGLGADGHDFEPVVPHLLWPDAPAIRFIFPHATTRAVTINAGMQMRAWYDIVGEGASRDHDQVGISQSVEQVKVLIEREEARGIPASRIVLAGFSQGGAIAIALALSFPKKLAGLIALSTYLLNADRATDDISDSIHNLPVFMGHGSMDPMVPLSWGEDAAQVLRDVGCSVEWRTYAMGHSVNPEEIAHISTWLSRRLS
jgi:phospholipase/carboxylesterase